MKDFTGQTFGRLTVLSFDSWHIQPSGQKKTKWNCVCECGNSTVVQGSNLSTGAVKSCGCMAREASLKKKHGKILTPTYKSWASMNTRCNNPNDLSYVQYGGAGVTVCDRWVVSKGGSFENFLEDMGERPAGSSLNRIKGSTVYSKTTCEWASRSLQNYDKNLFKNNKSGRVGVCWDKRIDKWVATITYMCRQITLLVTSSFEAACQAREEAEIRYFGFSKANR